MLAFEVSYKNTLYQSTVIIIIISSKALAFPENMVVS